MHIVLGSEELKTKQFVLVFKMSIQIDICEGKWSIRMFAGNSKTRIIIMTQVLKINLSDHQAIKIDMYLYFH